MRVGQRLRTLLVLGRVSNLPTVWSNCLAAWLLGGGGTWLDFGKLGVGAALLYTGGMFLNDAFDAGFDRQFRPERPIASGQIRRRTVAWLGAVSLAAGGLGLATLGPATAALALALTVIIVLYDAVHKRWRPAPLLMAACRFLLYLVAASAATRGPDANLLARAFALAAYVAGISFLARNESRRSSRAGSRWPVALLQVPLVVALAAGTIHPPLPWLPLLALGAWLGWCLRGALREANPDLSRGVAGLLAGIVLVDALAVAHLDLPQVASFAALWLLSLGLQRLVPAT
jgi:hypothetical protein